MEKQLKGSEKQIAWANEIIEKALATIEEQLKDTKLMLRDGCMNDEWGYYCWRMVEQIVNLDIEEFEHASEFIDVKNSTRNVFKTQTLVSQKWRDCKVTIEQLRENYKEEK